ncbi:MAG: YggT family protein [Acidobacteriota bacterium]|jgi:YggT family protein|nr:YggT family protein [Acidobacteriota bacterium]
MSLIASIYLFIWYGVVAVIITVIVLMLLRLALNYADVNPFSRPALLVRRFSDPLVDPVRRGLARAGLDPKIAPIGTILIAILLGYFALQLVGTFLGTIAGVIDSLGRGAIVSLIGHLLYGLLALLSLLIFMRIVFAWGASSVNRVLRFLIRVTEPVLAPFRRIIPPLGMFDISPIVVLLLIRLFQEAVAGTLIR